MPCGYSFNNRTKRIENSYKSFPVLYIPHKNHLEHGAHKRLNEKQLGKESKREIVAHKAKPLNQCDMDLKAVIIGIIKESCDTAHSRNLGNDG